MAVHDVNFVASRGEVVGLLGDNGAGKSTLIKMAVGLLCPDQGDVRVEGTSAWGNPRLGSLLGYVPAGDALPEFMSGLKFLTQLLRFHGHSRRIAVEAASAALERVGLTAVSLRRLRTYSKGMRQRLKLAQALAHDPPLLILDEPLTGLDPFGRRDIMALVRELGTQGRTVLVSSHILHEVESMTDRVALLRHGRLIGAGRIADLRSALLDNPYRIRVRVPEARSFGTRLLAREEILSVRVASHDELIVETAVPESAAALLTSLAAEDQVAIQEIDMEDQDLEAVFRYTVHR
jgi:ABC-2 type transport system ATP-binding protein